MDVLGGGGMIFRNLSEVGADGGAEGAEVEEGDWGE